MTRDLWLIPLLAVSPAVFVMVVGLAMLAADTFGWA